LELPFTEKNENELANKMKNLDYKEIAGPEDLKILIRNLLKVNPDERITYNEIKKLPFLKAYFDAYE